MTTDEMEAGPELDALVAVALDPYCTVGPAAIGEHGEDILAVWKWKGQRDWIPLPKFSTDIAAAWEVVEKVAPQLEIKQCFNLGEAAWLAVFSHEFYSYAPTAPLAICRAALKVLEK